MKDRWLRSRWAGSLCRVGAGREWRGAGCGVEGWSQAWGFQGDGQEAGGGRHVAAGWCLCSQPPSAPGVFNWVHAPLLATTSPNLFLILGCHAGLQSPQSDTHSGSPQRNGVREPPAQVCAPHHGTVGPPGHTARGRGGGGGVDAAGRRRRHVRLRRCRRRRLRAHHRRPLPPRRAQVQHVGGVGGGGAARALRATATATATTTATATAGRRRCGPAVCDGLAPQHLVIVHRVLCVSGVARIGTEKCSEVDSRCGVARTDDRRRPGGCRDVWKSGTGWGGEGGVFNGLGEYRGVWCGWGSDRRQGVHGTGTAVT